MNNKYYTPEIEEFHVGLEYEVKERFLDGTVKTQEDFDNSKWISQICDSGIMYIERALKGKNSINNICGIRVKCLDIEDIKKLGWNQIEYDTYKLETQEIYFEFNPEYKNFIWKKDGFNGEYILFRGTIKNKFELKKIMKQLGIIQLR
jgi:hypothetical protein